MNKLFTKPESMPKQEIETVENPVQTVLNPTHTAPVQNNNNCLNFIACCCIYELLNGFWF